MESKLKLNVGIFDYVKFWLPSKAVTPNDKTSIYRKVITNISSISLNLLDREKT